MNHFPMYIPRASCWVALRGRRPTSSVPDLSSSHSAMPTPMASYALVPTPSSDVSYSNVTGGVWGGMARYSVACGASRKGGKAVRKGDLPAKVCVTCGRPFTWRKKCADVWDEVKYCSDRCRNARGKGDGGSTGSASPT